MPGMEGWTLATPISPSFSEYFKIQVDLPEDRSKSRSNKGTSLQEEASAPSLHRLAELDIHTLTLSGSTHNMIWAESLLAKYSPVEPINWTRRGIEVGTPSKIESEANTLSYVESVYLGRALCAGWFLYSQSVGYESSPCPKTRVLYWHDTSSSGDPGRPDRTLFSVDTPVTLVEGKTALVCKSWLRDQHNHKVDVLHKLAEYAAGFCEDNAIDTWLRAGDSWETKGRQFLLQAWHQMFTKSCSHSIITSQECFILCLRNGSTLQLCPVTRFCHPPTLPLEEISETGEERAESDEDMRVKALTRLSFFIAHALCKMDGGGPPNPHRSAVAQVNPTLQQSATSAVGASKSQATSSTTQPLQSGNQGSWRGGGSTHLGIVNMRIDGLKQLYGRKLRVGLSFGRGFVARILKEPFSAVFITSGWASQSFPLTNACAGDNTGRWHRLIIDRIIQENVYRGNLDGSRVVVKIASDGQIERLRHEMEVYKSLKDLQGEVIPICYGMFLVGDSWAVLILEDCGTPPGSFSDLSSVQRQCLIEHLSTIHAKSIEHNDIEPRNIVVRKDKIKVIDFGLAEAGHECHGTDMCAPLQSVKGTLLG